MAARIEYRQVVDDRFDPFNESDQSVAVSTERHVVPTASPFQIQLLEVPRQDSPSTVTIAGFTEVSGTPSAGEFRVDYKYRTGFVQFNSADGGTAIAVSYQGTGTPVAAYAINELLDRSGVAAGPWTGHDWADHFVLPVTPGAPVDVATLNSANIDRGGTTPQWVRQTGTYATDPTLALPHVLKFESGATDTNHGGVFVNQAVYVSDVPVMFDFRVATLTDTLTIGYAWGLCSATVALAGTFPASSAINPRAMIQQTATGSPGYVKFITCDSAGLTTTDTIPVVDTRSFTIFRLEARTTAYKLYVANTFGVFIERANHTTNLPNTYPLVFGMFEAARGGSGTARMQTMDYARRTTLGNSVG